MFIHSLYLQRIPKTSRCFFSPSIYCVSDGLGQTEFTHFSCVLTSWENHGLLETHAALTKCWYHMMLSTILQEVACVELVSNIQYCSYHSLDSKSPLKWHYLRLSLSYPLTTFLLPVLSSLCPTDLCFTDNNDFIELKVKTGHHLMSL